MTRYPQGEIMGLSKMVNWIVGYEYDGCPGAAFTTREYKEEVIEAPEDREEAKKVAVTYLDGLKQGSVSIRASGRKLVRV